jgi:hypothetical protein
VNNPQIRKNTRIHRKDAEHAEKTGKNGLKPWEQNGPSKFSKNWSPKKFLNVETEVFQKKPHRRVLRAALFGKNGAQCCADGANRTKRHPAQALASDL